ncbi:hypothetical protein OHB33_00900 [Streptomyces sp. NBC_01558]|uniref:hypothetical protein n=1 Tax=Streptomyces sp. NBC_01558 TaxID=2975878 RepID=UPI002DD900CF|nr:hypothetical protein [Streptomyces sp. NBC_01558]WSD82113.1 hypothetical protein OHB33_00900 [Streptomyces sp. NBC_01558]
MVRAQDRALNGCGHPGRRKLLAAFLGIDTRAAQWLKEQRTDPNDLALVCPTNRPSPSSAFEDVAADCTAGAAVEPRSTGEEMALHLGIARAHDLTLNRPRLVADTVAGLSEERGDLDWDACSSDSFEDHDVLMLFDDSLDGIEDAEGEVH